MKKTLTVNNKNNNTSCNDYYGFLLGKEKGIDFEDRVRRNNKERMKKHTTHQEK